jgi:hypothetical protein
MEQTRITRTTTDMMTAVIRRPSQDHNTYDNHNNNSCFKHDTIPNVGKGHFAVNVDHGDAVHGYRITSQ